MLEYADKASTPREGVRAAAPEPEASSSYLAADARVTPLEGPMTIALQPGHWLVSELLAEHAHRRTHVDAIHQGVREVDINIAVTNALVPLLEAEGWKVKGVPATVPPGLRADAFLSIHADWGARPSIHGWKIAAPWRPSTAANTLAASLRSAFHAESNLREDVGGVTVGMRGYYGFASHRFRHASSPYTPAVLVELGFITNPDELRRMLDQPEYCAGILHRGLLDYVSHLDRNDIEGLTPRRFEPMRVAETGATARGAADINAPVLRAMHAGESVRVVDEHDGWFEVRLRTPTLTGWVHETELASFRSW